MTEPYFDDGQVRLLLGDCLDVLPSLPAASIDAVVCDPPYALPGGFMGREWDRHESPRAFQAWCEQWAAECRRVLKPGGHLLAFGAPRTYHRLAAGIEDAGFEVRDSIHWIFGQGYPKGQDIAKSIDKRRDDRSDVLQVTAWLRQARDSAGWTSARVDALFGFNGMASHWCAVTGKAAIVPTLEQWAVLRETLGFDDSEILPLVEELNARKGEIGEAFERRETVGIGYRVRREFDVQIAGLSSGRFDVTAPALDAAKRWEGWNTALKPAHEPIVMARKSTGFNTTVANVLEHGTGALNIDGCRVEGDSRRLVERRPGGDVAGDVYARDAWSREHMHGSVAAGETNVGRWPSNLVLTHAPGCDDACVPGCPVAELDRQSGVLASGANPTRRGSDKFRDAYGDFPGQRECTPARGADSGGASRFFPVFRYEAKASAAERPKLPDGTAWPTVKPVELMRWLVRLVTPPGGLVLDPFCGTAATGEAAIAEGFRCVLVEKDPVAAELAMVRLRRPIQPSLFGDLGAAS